MKSKYRLINTIKVIDALLKKERITIAECKTLAGAYWDNIKDDLMQSCKADCGRFDFACIFPEKLEAFKKECEDEIMVIENEEYDRELNREHKKTNIRYTRRAYVISCVSLIISLLTAAGVPQCLWKLLRKVISSAFCS